MRVILDYVPVFEWDRPGEAYAGKIRIITSRREDGLIGACHEATPQEIERVERLELTTAIRELTAALKARA